MLTADQLRINYDNFTANRNYIKTLLNKNELESDKAVKFN